MKQYNTCLVERRKLVTSYKVNFGSGGEVPGSRETEWKTEPCNTPLFSNNDMETGICKSCANGWRVDENYPTDTNENRELVPHYFTEAEASEK